MIRGERQSHEDSPSQADQGWIEAAQRARRRLGQRPERQGG